MINDISARDNRRAGQWIFSKGMDSFAPFSPVIVTADEIPDPQSLTLWPTVNGVEKQRSTTAHMLFKVDELIADLSTGITLEPGDFIASGTPAGVGAGASRRNGCGRPMWSRQTVVIGRTFASGYVPTRDGSDLPRPFWAERDRT